MWVQIVLREINISSPKASCLSILEQSIYHIILYARTKHIEVDYHFVRERFIGRMLEISSKDDRQLE